MPMASLKMACFSSLLRKRLNQGVVARRALYAVKLTEFKILFHQIVALNQWRLRGAGLHQFTLERWLEIGMIRATARQGHYQQHSRDT